MSMTISVPMSVMMPDDPPCNAGSRAAGGMRPPHEVTDHAAGPLCIGGLRPEHGQRTLPGHDDFH
jgi:hypothetical protein